MYKIIAISQALLQQLRVTLRDPNGNMLVIETAKTNRSICRSCLKRFIAGEKRLLLQYNPFTDFDRPSGPIYVHAHACKPFLEEPNLKSNIPSGIKTMPIVLKGYDFTHTLTKTWTGSKDLEKQLFSILSTENPQSMASIHLHDGEYGCFICKVIPQH